MDGSLTPQANGPPAPTSPSTRVPILWEVLQAASPLGFWWLEPATVYALDLPLIAAVYIGFAVADGRLVVLAVESSVASLFVILAAVAITGTEWLLVVGTRGPRLDSQ